MSILKAHEGEIRNLLLSGLTFGEIAKQYNVSKQAISLFERTYLKIPKTQRGASLRKKQRHLKQQQEWGRETWRHQTDLIRRQHIIFTRKYQNRKNTGYEWSIGFDDLVWPEKCPILGITLNYFNESRAEDSPSFDRIDNSKGYIPGNVQIISWRANRIKNDGTAEEHRQIANFIDTLSLQVK